MTETPIFVDNLTDAVTKTFKDVGIRCRIKVEPVKGTKLYRFFVISKQFKEMQYSERQSVVWRIVDKALPPEDAAKVSMIMTLTPAEFGET